MVSVLIELVGFACLVVFAFLCWPPAAFGVLGLGLLVAAQALPDARGKK